MDAIFMALASLPAAEQRALIEDGLVDDATYQVELRELARHFRAGCDDCVCQSFREQAHERAAFWRAMVTARNERWVGTLQDLKPGKDYVVAVGAAHTCGQRSLLKLLRSRGFTVTRIGMDLEGI